MSEDFLRCASIHTNICMCALSKHLFTLMLYKGSVIRFRYHNATQRSRMSWQFFLLVPILHNGIVSQRKECISLVHLFLIFCMFFHVHQSNAFFMCDGRQPGICVYTKKGNNTKVERRRSKEIRKSQ